MQQRLSVRGRVLGLLCLVVLLAAGCTRPGAAERELPAFDPARADPAVSDLRERGGAVESLAWLQIERAGLPPELTSRSGLLEARRRAIEAGDAATVARLNGVLAGEAFSRAGRVVRRWLERRDQASDLFPRSFDPEGQAWVYGDTGADLFGHLAIGTRLLASERYPEILETLAAERRAGPRLPDDLTIPGGQPRGGSKAERVFGAAEYAKDGLLPLAERVGPEPWLGRIVELADAILAEADVPTARGPIPADSAEVNGDMLQVLARLSWATGDLRYQAAAERIALTYLDVLPTTRYLPPHRWDFVENEPLDRKRFRLSDHGNEVLSGLLEWHLGATLRGDPSTARHREPIRRMLDRLLEKGRNEDGLWFRVLEIPTAKVDGEGLTDNWGYLLQAYLMAALVEERLPGGDPARAESYRQAARQALRALPRYAYYEWQQGQMDGYADTIESALYLLEPAAGLGQGPGSAPADLLAANTWVDPPVGVLYGVPTSDRRVEDSYLDGNFVRTALLYGLARTQGVRPEPWREGLLLGAAVDGGCLVVSAASPSDWSGVLLFDTPRHRLHLRLPIDYPRLNKWPEWFVVEPGRGYRVSEGGGAGGVQSGEALAGGLGIELKAGVDRSVRVCPE